MIFSIPGVYPKMSSKYELIYDSEVDYIIADFEWKEFKAKEEDKKIEKVKKDEEEKILKDLKIDEKKYHIYKLKKRDDPYTALYESFGDNSPDNGSIYYDIDIKIYRYNGKIIYFMKTL